MRFPIIMHTRVKYANNYAYCIRTVIGSTSENIFITQAGTWALFLNILQTLRFYQNLNMRRYISKLAHALFVGFSTFEKNDSHGESRKRLTDSKIVN